MMMLIGVLFLMLVSTSLSASGQGMTPIVVKERYEAVPFGPGAIVIPMDEKQNHTIHSFGLIHALLRNETVCYRLIGPPGTFIKTDAFEDGANYTGGPIILSGYNETVVDEVLASFPAVTHL